MKKLANTKRILYLSLAFVPLFSIFQFSVAHALSDADIQSIYNDTVWYNPSGGSINSSFCLGGPGGSGPLYGPSFPQVPDTAALASAIKTYISTALPSSPMVVLAEAYVGFGVQYNVNPALVVAITQKETSLATTGYGTSPKFNIGNIRDSNDSTGFASYASYEAGLEAIYKNLASGLYLGPPSNDTTISQIMNTYAPPSDKNDTVGYIQFIGDIMKKIFGSLNDLPTTVTTDSCSSGGTSGNGVVDNGANAQLAQKLLDYQNTGQYSCDNIGDCADLQKIVSGQSLAGSDGCQATTLDAHVLKLLLYIIGNGFKVGTYALCGDHSFDSPGGHSGGFAVDISTVNGASLAQDTPQAASEGLMMDQFLNNLPPELHLSQQISYGYGEQYSQPMAALQQYGGKLCDTNCVSIYTLAVENQHKNHIHVGF